MTEDWISIKEASIILECSNQNVMYLAKGKYRKEAKRRKIVPPKFTKIKTIQRGKYVSILLDRNEVINYKNSKENHYESI
jgi:hypothetical protein